MFPTRRKPLEPQLRRYREFNALVRLYLDLCCFNRPCDDQGQTGIPIEIEAKVIIQQELKAGDYELLWSSILDFECSGNPLEEYRIAIMDWREIASAVVLAETRW